MSRTAHSLQYILIYSYNILFSIIFSCKKTLSVASTHFMADLPSSHYMKSSLSISSLLFSIFSSPMLLHPSHMQLGIFPLPSAQSIVGTTHVSESRNNTLNGEPQSKESCRNNLCSFNCPLNSKKSSCTLHSEEFKSKITSSFNSQCNSCRCRSLLSRYFTETGENYVNGIDFRSVSTVDDNRHKSFLFHLHKINIAEIYDKVFKPKYLTFKIFLNSLNKNIIYDICTSWKSMIWLNSTTTYKPTEITHKYLKLLNICYKLTFISKLFSNNTYSENIYHTFLSILGVQRITKEDGSFIMNRRPRDFAYRMMSQCCSMLLKLCLGTTLLAMILKTYHRNKDWVSDDALYTSGIATSPAKGVKG